MKKTVMLSLLLFSCGETNMPQENNDKKWPVSDFWSVQCTEGSDPQRCQKVKCFDIQPTEVGLKLTNTCNETLRFSMEKTPRVIGDPMQRRVPFSMQRSGRLLSYQYPDREWELSNLISYDIKYGESLVFGVPYQCDQWNDFSYCDNQQTVPIEGSFIVDATFYLALPQIASQDNSFIDIDCGNICAKEDPQGCQYQPDLMMFKYRFDINIRCEQ